MSVMRMRFLSGVFRRIKTNQAGVALVEFAVLSPILITLYIGGVQLCEVIACARKVTSTARAVVDLTTQYSSISPQQIDGIMSASNQIMYPYDGASSFIRVSEIKIDENGVARVVWSRSKNGSPREYDAEVAIDAVLATPGTMYIYGEAEYKLKPSMQFVFSGDFTLGDAFVMLPRISTKVNCNDC
ncbi:TadE/TadG family type IV pilus assembly protein [Novosphingobium sp. RD2P27]|uniref:TadE/TadG family type IV pilus assembly protein n=1 Tax=Novosphingobium kalidii TaxID=3230299 RepID=A0ABV2CZN0_9SPHN